MGTLSQIDASKVEGNNLEKAIWDLELKPFRYTPPSLNSSITLKTRKEKVKERVNNYTGKVENFPTCIILLSKVNSWNHVHKKWKEGEKDPTKTTEKKQTEINEAFQTYHPVH